MEFKPHWARKERTDSTRIAAARDIIRNCLEPHQDRPYAERHGLSVDYVCKIRTGRAWKALRRKMQDGKRV